MCGVVIWVVAFVFDVVALVCLLLLSGRFVCLCLF